MKPILYISTIPLLVALSLWRSGWVVQSHDPALRVLQDSAHYFDRPFSGIVLHPSTGVKAYWIGRQISRRI